MKYGMIAITVASAALFATNDVRLTGGEYRVKAVCPWRTFNVVASARAGGKLYLEFSDPKAPLGYVGKICDTTEPTCQVGRCKVYLTPVKEDNATKK